MQLRQHARAAWHVFTHGHPDAAESATPLPPLHLRPLPVLLVFVGASVGTLARYELSALPAPDGLPLPTFFVNIVGAFLLGVLLEALLRGGPDAGWRQTARLLLGTGFMGGFTTYSTFSVEVAMLSGDGRYVTGFGYAILSLLLGVGAAALGVWVSANLAPVPKARPIEDATAFSPEPLSLTDAIIAADPSGGQVDPADPAGPAATPAPPADSASAPPADSAKPNGDPE